MHAQRERDRKRERERDKNILFLVQDYVPFLKWLEQVISKYNLSGDVVSPAMLKKE